MAIDLKKFIDNSLKAEFLAKPYDPSKGRKLFIEGIARTLKQFNGETAATAPKKWFKVNGQVVEFTAKLASNVVPVAGSDTNYIPRSQFSGFLTALSAAADHGELDAEIKTALTTEATAEALKSKSEQKDKFPGELHPDYDKLTKGQKIGIGKLWNAGKNPDGSLRSDVGDKPEAKYAPSK